MDMRGRIAVATVTVALLLGGCASTSPTQTPAVGSNAALAPSPVPAGPEVHPATGDAARRAAEVTAAWPGSPAQQAWEHGYFPTEDTTEWLADGAFHSGDDKAAYYSGRFDLKTTLPVAVSGTAEVQFADGSRLTLPQRTAQAVLDSLTEKGGVCPGDCGGRLTITAVQPGTTTVATSRGQATIPVWEFTITGYDRPFRYPAVLPQAQAGPAHGPNSEPGSTWLRSVSSDGLVLTATVPHGTCSTLLPGEVYETDQAVVLIGRTAPVTPDPDHVCDAALRATPVEFRLSHPLGTRAVLGLADGRPQALPAQH
ncbi:hypothetical protein ACFYS8_27785 [Kitasatospora sp. NPDC004615]|uniref:hypothetical protein n=1 Tax=Kitasatospora sp. NPDC004615 TaxID=3364017 RepID=UPI0036737025